MPFSSFKPILRTSIVVGGFISFILAGVFLFKVAYPFLIGFVLAFLMNPLVLFLERTFKFNRTIAVCISLLIFFLLASSFMTFLIAEIITGTAYLAKILPIHLVSLKEGMEFLFFTQIFPIFERLMAIFATLDAEQQQTVLSSVRTFTTELTETVSLSIQALLHTLSQFLLSLPNLATASIFSLLSAFFISKDWKKLTLFTQKALPRSIFSSIHSALHDLKHALYGYFRGQVILISITCFLTFIGFLLLEIKYPITVALLLAAVDLIPYLGTGVIFIPWIIYAFMTEQPLSIGLVILYGIVLITRQILEPRVLSASIGIDPFAMLVSLFIGFQLFQFIGLLLGPISLIFIRSLHRIGTFRDLWFYISNEKRG